MPSVVYNRRLNDKPRVFKFFTYWEFTALMFIIVTPIFIGNVLNLPPTFLDSFILVILFTLYILRFKLGRPEGYFSHWLKSYTTFKHFRPGHVSLPLPIDLPPSSVPSMGDLAKTELELLDAGFYFFAPGQALPVDAVLPEIVEAGRAQLERGEPLSTNYYVLDETISQK